MSKATFETGYLCNFEAPGFEAYKEGDDIPMNLLIEAFRSVEKNWTWTTTDPEGDRVRAVELLEGPRVVL